MQITRQRPETRQGAAENVTGTVWLDELAAPPGPVPHVTEGEGLVQRRGGEVEQIRAGDTVWIEPGEWHWHGVGPRTFMTHLADVEAAEDGTTAEWDARAAAEDHPA